MPEHEKILRRSIPIWTPVYYRSRGIISTFELITTYMTRPVEISERMLSTARKSTLKRDLAHGIYSCCVAARFRPPGRETYMARSRAEALSLTVIHILRTSLLKAVTRPLLAPPQVRAAAAAGLTSQVLPVAEEREGDTNSLFPRHVEVFWLSLLFPIAVFALYVFQIISCMHLCGVVVCFLRILGFVLRVNICVLYLTLCTIHGL